MRKSVLIMKTPEKCLDCNLYVLDMDGSLSCYYYKKEICSNVGENNSRPEWCPLKIMKIIILMNGKMDMLMVGTLA